MRAYRILLDDDTGAVTIDWVAITAAVLLLGIMVVYAIFNGGVSSLVSNINSTLVATTIVGDVGDERTGNAANQACIKTGRYTVCMGPK